MAQPHDQELREMSEADYLAFDDQSTVKHEYVNGRVYAMTGASWNHTVIMQNAATMFATQLLETDCVVVASEIKLKVESQRVSFRYPDIMVVCGEPQFVGDRTDIITNPIIIIEVLSPSTALEDRNTKLSEYTSLDSVQAYMLISQDEPKVEVFTRHEPGKWLYMPVTGLDASAEVTSVGCTLSLAQLYRKVNLQRDEGSA